MANSKVYETTPATFIYVPPSVKSILLVSSQSDSNVEFIVTQPFQKQRHSFIPQVGGSLLCLCAVNRFSLTVFLESERRRYVPVKIKHSKMMLLVEQTWNPFSKTQDIPRLWDLAANNMLLQGYSKMDCNLLLEKPLHDWQKVTFHITLQYSKFNKKNWFPSCINPRHVLHRFGPCILPAEFWVD